MVRWIVDSALPVYFAPMELLIIVADIAIVAVVAAMLDSIASRT